MIDLDLIDRGAVVQLMSGSPMMTVRGFKPVAQPNSKAPGRTHAICLVWSHRHGFIERDFAGHELRFPAPRPAPAPADLAPGDDNEDVAGAE